MTSLSSAIFKVMTMLSFTFPSKLVQAEHLDKIFSVSHRRLASDWFFLLSLPQVVSWLIFCDRPHRSHYVLAECNAMQATTEISFHFWHTWSVVFNEAKCTLQEGFLLKHLISISVYFHMLYFSFMSNIRLEFHSPAKT